MKTALHYSHELLDQLINRFPNGYFVDATLGNGFDTLHILSQPNFNGHLYGFDIQAIALEHTLEKLEQANIAPDRYDLFHRSHAELQHVIATNQELHGAIFNLGYLPGADHTITTHAESSWQAIQQIMSQLIQGGQIILVVYWGHEAGFIESQQLEKHLQKINQSHYQVLKYQFINQINRPPYTIVIERK
ncbi:tRNA (mnm(5)s(2)U34)-methyltransferase [Vaginisenegalia massiliensis]|uniref:tRNA (mnm(5)s(2)U34)-methyltransferase n=1 Tax=Vaginisenegalia massiliensis TaxID=2058294 RepID=UPI000F52D78B|nr:class I SAM-dependent methyltransferase [Vaginisenegalia massiliensis]